MPVEDERLGKPIRVCVEHQEEYLSPLLFTFAFPQKEWWCPYCGRTGGMFGMGEEVPATETLLQRKEAQYEHWSTYLHAQALIVGGGKVNRGGRMCAFKDLLWQEQERFILTSKSWTPRVPL